MVPATHPSTAMRGYEPDPAPSPEESALVTIGLLAAALGGLVALSYPVTTAILLAAVATTAIGVTLALDYRRRLGCSREFCLPVGDVCVEV